MYQDTKDMLQSSSVSDDLTTSDRIGSTVEQNSTAGMNPFVKQEECPETWIVVTSCEYRSCLVCLKKFSVCENKVQPFHTLCQAMRIPVKVTDEELQDYLKGPIYCEACEIKVHETAEILEQLDYLDRLLTILAQEFKDAILKSFKDGETHPATVIRKTFAQCSAPCYIPITEQEYNLATQKSRGTECDEIEVEIVDSDSVFSPGSAIGSCSDEEIDANVVSTKPCRRSLRSRGKVPAWKKLLGPDIVEESSPRAKRKKSSAGAKRGSSNRKNVISRFACTRTLPSFKCSICRKGFTTQEIRDVHQFKKHKGIAKPYECSQCGRNFEKPCKLLAHQKRWHAVVDAAAGPSHSDTHAVSAENDNPGGFACSQCFMMFRSEDSLEAHFLRIHEGMAKPFTCAKCDMPFRHKVHLTKHTQLHQNTKDFPCNQCDKSYLSRRKLLLHKAKVHSIGDDGGKKFRCDQCPKKFSRLYLLENHMYQHSGEKRFICEMCGQSYSCSRRLKVHLQRHNGESSRAKESHQCQQCGKFFSEGPALKLHIRSIHDKVFRFHCEVCGQGAQSLSMLNRHMLCHTEEKKHVCTVCGMKFKRPPQLVQHMYLHEGKKPYMCKLCDKGFRSSEKLKNHEKLHTGEKPFICEQCGKSYALKHYLTNHVNTSHRGMKPKKRPRTDSQLRKGHLTNKIEISTCDVGGSETNAVTSATPAPVIAFASGRNAGASITQKLSSIPHDSNVQILPNEVSFEWVQMGTMPSVTFSSSNF